SDFNDSLVFQYLKNTHKHFKKSKRGQHDCICMFNMMKRCTRDPCTQVHSTMPYLWEINYNENFLRLSYEQSDHLERLFCHPAQDKAEFPPLPSNVRHHSRYEQLRNVLSSSESWQVDMETMKISSGSSSIVIRRLSTPSDITYDLRVASRWIWYWCDDNGSWKPYTHGDNNKYFVVALSDHLEYHMHFSNEFHFFVKVGGQHYDIDTREMTQKNIITGKIRKIRRRPACTVLEDKETSFDRMFTKLPKDKNNDLSKVNEQYLFHGTKHSVIDLICSENLDWRLFGRNVGNAYGQGTYFANNAKLSDSYSKTDDSGLRAMFIVYVLVGTMTVGNRSMEFPPTNTTTGRCFDSTCNDRHDSTIIVKYNKDEYYPAYLVKYRTA
ncbi:mono-ADP-ribosyltransferase PARP12-like 1, partial [Homarus americanus]